ncbi:hypothetical protein GPECTOR_130g575 [Gonium pectorale]|uniref:Sugar phosphate transporter domain-containing protein n=1 Tax=Gonium pectorale TaxID=33097 RepID=A0A150FYB6_GONPE|nr:hypothetical protein GPECTOR_130g575 [Gonium pectorale]|eukprot:KXZ42614.1 hypothetical protein GPECTOR_130g575 [Gonium pectorale]
MREMRFEQVAPLAACYCVHAVLVLYSLAFLSVPMYNTLKRLTPVIVLVMKAGYDRRWPDVQTTSSVLLIVGGCLVAGAGDLSFDAKGYTLALFCAGMQATYILLAERAGGGGSHGNGADGGSSARRKHHLSETSLADAENNTGEALTGASPAFGNKQDLAHSTGVEVHAHPVSVRIHNSQGSGPTVPLCDPLPAAPSKAGFGSGTLGPSAGLGAAGSGHGDPGQPLSAMELLYTLSCIAVPALTLMCLVMGDGAQAPSQLAKLRVAMGAHGFAAWLGVTAVMEGLLTGCLFLCTHLNSALTTSIVGVLKGAVSSVLGFFLLGGVKFHALNVTGICMNFMGGAWYSFRPRS